MAVESTHEKIVVKLDHVLKDRGEHILKKQLKPKKTRHPRISSIESWLFIKREFLMSTVSFNPHITSDLMTWINLVSGMIVWEDHIHQLETLKTHVFPQLPFNKKWVIYLFIFSRWSNMSCMFFLKSMSSSPCSRGNSRISFSRLRPCSAAWPMYRRPFNRLEPQTKNKFYKDS